MTRYSAALLLFLDLGLSAGCIDEQSLGDPEDPGTSSGSTTLSTGSTSTSRGSGTSTSSGPSSTTGGQGECVDPTDGSCTNPCALATGAQGCEFHVLGRSTADVGAPQGLWIFNPSPTRNASVVVEFVLPGLVEGDEMNSVSLLAPAGELTSWQLPSQMIPSATSTGLSTGRYLHVRSDRPVTLERDTLLEDEPSVDAEVVLPSHDLRSDYAVLDDVDSFQVLATQETTVEWTPTARTLGNGLPVPAVEAGEVGTLLLTAGSVLRIRAAEDGQLLTGTELRADQPFVCAGCR